MQLQKAFHCPTPRNFTGKVGQQRAAKHIIGIAVQLRRSIISAPMPIADFVGRILPDLADNDLFLHAFLCNLPQQGNKGIRQLIGHIKTPSGNALTPPMTDHTIRSAQNIIKIPRFHLIYIGKRLYAPPALVVIILLSEPVPGTVFGGRIAVSALLRCRPARAVSAESIKIDTVIPRMTEHTVQNEPNTMFSACGNHGIKGFLSA